MYRIIFHPEAKQEFDFLDGSQRKLVLKKLEQISRNPFLGEKLGNKAGFDLTDCLKTYVDKKKLRIVYMIHATEIIVEVVGVGKREKFEVYQTVHFRIH